MAIERGALRGVAIVLACLSMAGCIPKVYRHTVQPLTLDFERTPVVDGPPARSDVRQFRYRAIDVRWNRNAIGMLAREAGFDTIHYADIEELSILGIFSRTWVIVYGVPAQPAVPAAEESAKPDAVR